ncbi:hypothetical protein E4T50_08467 [Aureobasidium sp. EXF-12298]|nr:hypothetical protein E4T50_08467 [Aureobasidium sp. EXF-12298]
MSQRISFKVEGRGTYPEEIYSYHDTDHTPVQGVNFRSFTVKQAKSLGITGHVQNANDGTVTGEAQGDSSSLKEFQQHLNKGPSAATVTKLDVNDIKTKEGESDFTQ